MKKEMLKCTAIIADHAAFAFLLCFSSFVYAFFYVSFIFCSCVLNSSIIHGVKQLVRF